MPGYTDKDKEKDFPALQHVCSHMQMLVWLPKHSAFTYAIVGRLKVNIKT
jgi:hypothetical protein